MNQRRVKILFNNIRIIRYTLNNLESKHLNYLTKNMNKSNLQYYNVMKTTNNEIIVEFDTVINSILLPSNWHSRIRKFKKEYPKIDVQKKKLCVVCKLLRLIQKL